MSRKYVCVLDMDETLGFSAGETFHVRPKFQCLINFLKVVEADIILWSLGSDDYVRRVASTHIRDMYQEPIFLMAVDDKVSENMDEQYDLRIYIPPYTKVNSCDKELLLV
ncbi:FCP1 homology domain-containing protein [Nephila pilipes]|uniref:FCP1 homology domain-containing protein n=1 Tax=Nephila pilipes TaxID=299642 RepID=A0A8X6PNN3_NEPPI|nr:FCP1 homology domain-containing protein [Nephila pilipes]